MTLSPNMFTLLVALDIKFMAEYVLDMRREMFVFDCNPPHVSLIWGRRGLSS